MCNGGGHNIICFEGEWELNNNDDKFRLRTLEVLKFFSSFYGIKLIHRVTPTNDALSYYLDYFVEQSKKKRQAKKLASFDIIYFSCHGCRGKICLDDRPESCWEEAEDNESSLGKGWISLISLAEAYPTFFADKHVHFSSCSTLADTEQAKAFLSITHAKTISGYCSTVDAMQSALMDFILFKEFMDRDRIGTLNLESSTFRKNYGRILDELKFVMYTR